MSYFKQYCRSLTRLQVKTIRAAFPDTMKLPPGVWEQTISPTLPESYVDPVILIAPREVRWLKGLYVVLSSPHMLPQQLIGFYSDDRFEGIFPVPLLVYHEGARMLAYERGVTVGLMLMFAVVLAFMVSRADPVAAVHAFASGDWWTAFVSAVALPFCVGFGVWRWQLWRITKRLKI